ncbi:MAG: hypothetical protein CMI54_02735 [Parcubacteria group bacterium]|jgi:hypothetical protein|nr:hypothetical protein [Parcubacteria group bacterium]|tara:strand:- start:32720 stop:32902 length:183 start_codon:yes stop_codon:yes gene_type:complete
METIRFEPHHFRNEDGKMYPHPGYEIKKCDNRCDNLVIVSRSTLKARCGSKDCGKEKEIA